MLTINLKVFLRADGGFEWSFDSRISEDDEQDIRANVRDDFFVDAIYAAIDQHAPEPGTFYVQVRV